MTVGSTRLDRAASAFARMLAVLGLSLLLLFAVATLADALLRGLASRPLGAVRDLGGVLVAVSLASCFPLAFAERHNITITAIDMAVSARLGRVMEFLASIAGLVVLAAIATEFWKYAGKIRRAGETTIMLNIPVAPFWYAVDAIFWSAALVQLVICISVGRSLFRIAPATQANEGHPDR